MDVDAGHLGLAGDMEQAAADRRDGDLEAVKAGG
jgi:hypothetical protein